MASSLDSALASSRSRTFATVLVAAFAVKALALFVALPAVSSFFAGQYSIGFADDYDTLANNLATGIGYRLDPSMGPTMVREPGYPLFLAGLFKVLGYHIEVARLANLVLAIGITLMLSRLARRLSTDPAVPIVAALLFLFHPGILLAEARGGVELLFIFCLMLFLLALHKALDYGRRRDFLVAGLALGLVVMVRSTPILFPGLVLGYLLLTARDLGERARSTVNMTILVVGTVAVMTPWIARNYLLVQQLVPTASVQSVAAQEGQYTCEEISLTTDFMHAQDAAAEARNAVARELHVPFRASYYQRFFAPQDELAFNRVLGEQVVQKYVQNPGLLFKCSARNLVNFWILGKTWRATAVNALIQIPLLILAAIGMRIIWRSGLARQGAMIVLLMAYVLAVHAPVIAHARHSMPLVPFLAMFASISLVRFYRSRQTR